MKTSTHVLERTSPVGERFLGRCILCGHENLSIRAALEDCENPRGLSHEEAMMEAIEGGEVTECEVEQWDD